MMRRLSSILFLLAFSILFVDPTSTFALPNAKKIFNVPKNMILPIGVKIWSNESGGTFSGMLSWNEGEDFASLGIGHFVWRPQHGNASTSDDFFQLLSYMKKRGVKVPAWLRDENDAMYCPWHNRKEFMSALTTHSPQILDLQQLVLNTIPIQAEFIINRLELTLPKLLASVSPEERPYICRTFYSLTSTPQGIYVLADYLNFKGSGAVKNAHYGCGLLQVLEEMHSAPKQLPLLNSFVWSARMLLVQHVALGRTKYNEDAWLNGWLNRINTYLETDISHSSRRNFLLPAVQKSS